VTRIQFPQTPLHRGTSFLSFLVVASLTWCLRNARQKPLRRRFQAVVFGATICGTVALTLFAMWIWVFGLGTPTSGSTERPLVQATPTATRPVTWKAVRSIIAKQLNVPEERVTPGSRLRDDLNAKNDHVVKILTAFEVEFGIESQSPDDEVIFAAQDAFEYAQSPEAFTDRAFRSR
jgi:acyl carrier protein